MRILDFYKEYPDEASCKQAFKTYRESNGIACGKCGNSSHYWKSTREQWQCKACGRHTTLRSGTVMQNSKLSYQVWFIAMHLLTSTKKSFSAKEIQRQVGHNRYEPIWRMVHKIRSVMGLRDDLYNIKGEVELDDGFLETVSITRDKSEPLKRGRGSQRQTAVLVSAESKLGGEEYNSKKHGTPKKVKFIKMKVLNSLKKEHVTSIAKDMIAKGSSIVSDKSTSYIDLSNDFDVNSTVVPKEDINAVLPWVHKAISNAKRLLLDTHHRIDDDFLQNYLNEFCYKFNRRYFSNLFERLMIAAVSFKWDFLGETCG